MGHEAVLGLNKNSISPDRIDSTGRRSIRLVTLNDGTRLTSAEVSLAGLMHTDPLLCALRKSKDESDLRVIDKVLRASILMSIVTGSHGAYSSGP